MQTLRIFKSIYIRHLQVTYILIYFVYYFFASMQYFGRDGSITHIRKFVVVVIHCFAYSSCALTLAFR